jgi:hypothetical protein
MPVLQCWALQNSNFHDNQNFGKPQISKQSDQENEHCLKFFAHVHPAHVLHPLQWPLECHLKRLANAFLMALTFLEENANVMCFAQEIGHC